MIQVGGRIIQASSTEKGNVIVAEQLPIVQHPVYGPTENARRPGKFEFAFLYPDPLEPGALRDGNRFIVVGRTSGHKPVLVNGAPKTEPFIVAQCIHIWQTGRSEIASFKEDVGAGYSPLPSQTFCARQAHKPTAYSSGGSATSPASQ